MPLHDVGYREWSGKLTADWTRFLVVATTSIRLAWTSAWLRRMLLIAWAPAVGAGGAFFLYERAMLDDRAVALFAIQVFDVGEPFAPMFEPLQDALRDVYLEDGTQLFSDSRLDQMRGTLPILPVDATVIASKLRGVIWAFVLQAFFRYSQGLLMVMLVGLIAPPLISQDVRSRAFLFYFSRPLTRSEYILGKATTVWFYVGMITTLPALGVYVLGVLLSPDLNVVPDTWDLPFRVLIASVVLMVPTTALALMLSSLTQESRYAGFSWFAIWVLSTVTYGIIRGAITAQEATRSNYAQVPGVQPAMDYWELLSLYHVLGRVQQWVFGFDSFNDVWRAMTMLVTITVVSLTIVYRRVSAPMLA